MNNYTPEEIQLLKNIKQRKGTEQEGISALNAYRNSKTQQVQQEPQQKENKMFGVSSDAEILKKLKEAGVQKDEAIKIAEDINNFDNLSVADMAVLGGKLSEYGILEKTSFQKLKEMGKAGLMDYVAEGIRSVGQPFVQAGEFIQEKAIDPLVKGSVATMQFVTKPLQSGLRKLIGEENIKEMQADIDSTLNNASDDIKDFWNSLSEETKERNKLLFEALVPVLMVAGAVTAKAPMSAIAKSKADDAINLIAKNEKKAIEIAQKDYKTAQAVIEKSKKDFGDKKFTNEILKSTKGEKDILTKMVDIAKKNTEELAPDMLPEDLVGEELGNRLQYVYDNVQKLGKQKGEIIDTIADQKIDISNAVNNFKTDLEKYLGIKEKAKKINVDETDPLIGEAKKYKSAEEFIKAQKAPVYHGTNKDFEIFDSKKINSIEGSGDYVGEGFYFTDEPKRAKDYAKQAVKKTGGQEIVKEFYLNTKNPFIINNKNDIKKLNDLFGGEDARIELLLDNPKAVKQKLENLGYDGLIDNVYGQRAVFNPSQVKTKSQLIDIYNKSKEALTKSVTPKFSFANSRARLNSTAKELVDDFINWAYKKDGTLRTKTVKELDNYRGVLFDKIKTLAGTEKQFTGQTKSIADNLSKSLEENIANLSDDFRKINTQYAQARSGLEDTFKSLGYKKSVEELPKNIRKMSEFSRRTLGRASNEATNAIDKITEVAESLGYKSDKNIKRLSAFGEALTQKFGTPQSTSFKEQIRQGINPSDVTPQGAISKIAKGIEKITAETPEQAIEKQAKNLKDVIGASTTIKKLAKKAQSPIPKTNNILKTISNKVPIAGEAIQKNKLLTGLAGASSAISETLKNKR